MGQYAAATGTAEENTMYYRKVLGNWKENMNNNENKTKYNTIVNLTGGIIGHLSDNTAKDYLGGNVYGGGLGRLATNTETAIEAMVYGDIEVKVDGTAFIQRLKSPGTNLNDVPFSGRVFGCNNLNGTPKGNVTVTVSRTIPIVNGVVGTNHDENRFEIHSVYGGGNLASYMPADGKMTKVIIDGCDDTFIEKVFGGGNSASVPGTDVVILGSGYIGYAFGGGNGADMIYRNGSWGSNDGAPIFGNASIIAVGGKIGQVFSGSDTKGTVYGSATIKLASEGNVGYTSDCALRITNTYGAGRGADINGDVNYIVSACTTRDAIERVFGGSYDANIRGNVNLTITSGIFSSVYGANDHGGSIGGNVNVNIEETDGCNPIIIQHLYGGGREAAYPGNGAKNTLNQSVSRGKITINIKSATRIDNVYGGGYRALVNGDTEVNINMIKGKWINRTITFPESYRGDQIPNVENPTISYSEVTGLTYADPAKEGSGSSVNGYYIYEGKDEDDKDIYTKITYQDAKAQSGITYYRLMMSGTVKDDIGTIGNVYGGSFESLINGSSTINIGTETEIDIMKRATADTKDPDDVPIPEGTILAEDGRSIYNDNVIRSGIAIDTKSETVLGAHITGNVYGGGDQGDVGIRYDDNGNITVVGSTSVNIGVKGTEILNAENQPTGEYNYTPVSPGTSGVTIAGNVYGGGKGFANTFKCDKGMVGGTHVRIGNGTIGTINNGTLTAGTGNVYGGGEIGRTEGNTNVMIGTETGTSAPVIGGSVFGAGKGKNTHGYSALTRGNSTVTIQSSAVIGHSVYGGGEVASVGRYNVNASGMPESLANQGSGYCTVTVKGDAKIGPNDMTMPTFDGNVFGGGKGVLPYENVTGDPYRIKPNNTEQWFTETRYEKESTQPADYEAAYLKYIETLALATQTYVTIDGNAFIKGSVYGGSENGIVQHDTQVTISGGQIGNGWNPTLNNGAGGGINRPYNTTEWAYDVTSDDTKFLYECNSWPYGQAATNKYEPYDKYTNPKGDDGHTYYGNVFGGGSGNDPYSLGKWHENAGAVYGNTNVNITGGHILTNIYGGNEMTNVGKGASDTEHGKCTITFGGTATLGVPRTLTQIDAHPVTCYLFGGGKGDTRILFNKQTNVNDAIITITGGTIYGSVFGGGEDGHVMRHVTMTIGNNDGTGPKIGTWGTSYVDGNVFGGGRGFTGEAYTAGNVGGSIELNIKGGTMLGSVYGGGRLGSVGYGLYASTETGKYGVMQNDNVYDDGTTVSNFKRGYVTIDISGGTIGNNIEFIYQPTDKTKMPTTLFDADNRLMHTRGGNVYAGGMGRREKLDGEPRFVFKEVLLVQ